MGKRYVELEYEPRKEDLLAKFYVEPVNVEIANVIAAESSTGTWTQITTENKRAREKLKARVYELDEEKNLLRVAYNHEIFEKGNIPQMLSDFAGNILGMKAVKNIRLVDVRFPEPIVRSFSGPSLGLEKIKEKVGVKERPLLGTIVKPKVGLNPKQHAKVAYNAWLGGCDLVKDDENLTSQDFCNFEDRIRENMKLKEVAEEKTGEKKIYAANITAPYEKMVERAEFVKKEGGECIMVDILTVGFSALQSLAERFHDMILYGHRAMHAAFTRKEHHGIRMLVIAKLARLAGVEHLHTGTAIGKMEGEKEDIKEIDEFLTSEWYGLKKTIPVKSGGLHPGLVPKLVEILGTNIQITAGGGIAGHPQGPEAGARAMRQAIEAKMNDIDLVRYAKDHPELSQALEKWGTEGWKKETTYSG